MSCGFSISPPEPVTYREIVDLTGRAIIEKTITYSNESEKEKYMREIKLVQALRTSYFVPLHSFEIKESSIVIYCEKYDMNLQELINRYTSKQVSLSEIAILTIFITILKGLFSMHQLNLIHRNLNPESVYIKNNGEIAIGGLHRIRELDVDVKDRKVLSSMEYVSKYNHLSPYEAPELKTGKYNATVDVWSLGCLLYELVVPLKLVRSMFAEKKKLGKMNTYGSFKFNSKLEDLLNRMLSLDVFDRITTHDLMNDPYVQQCVLICRDKKIFANGNILPEMVTSRSELLNNPSVITNFLIVESPIEYEAKISSGGFGIVYICTRAGMTLIKKSIKKRPYIERNIDYRNESEHCHNLYHDNIITTLIHLTEEDEENYIIYLEYCEGGDLSKCLENLVKDGYRLTETGSYKILCSIINGLYHIHKHNLIHRDIKPDNILLSRNGSIFVSDLGILTDNTKNKANITIGTYPYMAPEMLKSIYSNNVDIYALGCVMFQICNVVQPPSIITYAYDEEDLGMWKLRPPYCDYEGLQELVWMMLRKDPELRISIDQLMDHPQIIRWNYKTKHLPFLLDGEPSALMITESTQETSLSQSSPTKDMDYILYDIITGTVPLPNINKTIHDKLSLNDLSKSFRYIFPSINEFMFQVQNNGLNIDDEQVIREIKRVVDIVLQLLGILYHNEKYTSNSTDQNMSWMKMTDIISGITRMLAIIRYIIDNTTAVNYSRRFRRILLQIYTIFCKMMFSNQQLLSNVESLLDQWLVSCTANRTKDLDLYVQVLCNAGDEKPRKYTNIPTN